MERGKETVPDDPNPGDMKDTDEKNLKKISKMHFLVDGMDIDHIKHVYGERCAGKTQEELYMLLKFLKADRKKIIDWGKGEIMKLMVSRSRQLGLRKPNGEPPAELLDLQMIWGAAADNGMSKFREILHHMYDVTISWAEENPTWATDMEKFYMESMDWEYMEDTMYVSKHCKATDTSGRGCIARVLTEARKRVMKTINYVAKKTHGISLRVQRTQEQIMKENEARGKKTKRLKGADKIWIQEDRVKAASESKENAFQRKTRKKRERILKKMSK